MIGFLKAEEAAAILGVHASTIHRWCQIGQLPYKRIGWRYWIPEAAVRNLNTLKPVLPVTEKPFLSIVEAARLLCVKPDTLRGWCQKGQIPARKPHWAWQIPREAVLERMEIQNPDPVWGGDSSPLDLRLIDDPVLRDAVEAGEIPHPRLVAGEETFDWQAWHAGTLPLQIAEANFHAQAQAQAEAPSTGSLAFNVSQPLSRPAVLDQIMTNAAAFMAEEITQTGAFSTLRLLRRLTYDQQSAYIDLLVSFRESGTPFHQAHREIGKRIGTLVRALGYVRAPDLDRSTRDCFDNPTTEKFFRPAPS